MTFKELLDSVQFEDVAPHIVRMYPDMENSIGWYKIHFDMLRLMNPVCHEDANDKVCNITMKDWEDGTGLHLNAYPMEGDMWEHSLTKELIIAPEVKASNGELAACCLWHTSFYGFVEKHMEKIKAQVARISASKEICQQAIQLIREILEAANSTIIIDANDIRDNLDCDGTLAVNDIRISAKVNDRMKELVGQIEKKIENNATVKSLLFHLFFPKELPLQMSELQPLGDWLSSFQPDSDLKVKWGMAATSQSSEPQLRAIVLVVT